MAESIEPPRMTEPEVVPCIFVEGLAIEVRDEFIRVVGYIDLETVGYEVVPERRIVVRASMPTNVARALIRDLRKAVARGGN